VVVDAGAGHRAQVRIKVPDNPEPSGRSAAAAVNPDSMAPQGTHDSESETISEGPARTEFTRFHWLKLGIGLGLIGGPGLALWLTRRRYRTALRPHTPSPESSTNPVCGCETASVRFSHCGKSRL
jgi:hypothetical protein